jgi:hypothetical protein
VGAADIAPETLLKFPVGDDGLHALAADEGASTNG